MTTPKLMDVLKRIEAWPEADQEELADVAREIEARHSSGYDANVEELSGIDRGLRAASEGRFASDRQVEAVFLKHRRA